MLPKTRREIFTSGLSIKELLQLKDAGFEPLGLTIGASVFQIGFQNLKAIEHIELPALTQAMYQARNLSLARMIARAGELGADGIVGLTLSSAIKPWGDGTGEFTAVGTAVRHSIPGSYLTPKGRPFTTALNGDDFWILISSGSRPLSYVIGNCVYQISFQPPKSPTLQAIQNVEMLTHSRAVGDGRELALARMRAEGEYYGGDGIIGASVTESSYGWNTHMVEYFASGSSISALQNPEAR